MAECPRCYFAVYSTLVVGLRSLGWELQEVEDRNDQGSPRTKVFCIKGLLRAFCPISDARIQKSDECSLWSEETDNWTRRGLLTDPFGNNI